MGLYLQFARTNRSDLKNIDGHVEFFLNVLLTLGSNYLCLFTNWKIDIQSERVFANRRYFIGLQNLRTLRLNKGKGRHRRQERALKSTWTQRLRGKLKIQTNCERISETCRNWKSQSRFYGFYEYFVA